MAVTLNANTSTGFIATSDTSGVLQLQTAGTTAVTISTGQVATFAQAPVLPAASIPQAALAAGVAGNGPAFSAYQSTAQTITNSTFTKVNFQTEEFDTNSNFASSTFTPTVAGYYQVTGAVYIGTTSGINILVLYKNGTAYKRISQSPSPANSYANYGSALVYLNGSTDYVELYFYQSSSISVTVPFPQADLVYFQGAMVRSA